MHWGQEPRCPVGSRPSRSWTTNSNTFRTCVEQEEDGSRLPELPEHQWGHSWWQVPADSPVHLFPHWGRGKCAFPQSAMRSAHGWDPTLATSIPVGPWPPGAVSFLIFITKLLSVYEFRLAGLGCVGFIVFLQTHGIMVKSLDTLTPPSGFVFQMTPHYLLNTLYPILRYFKDNSAEVYRGQFLSALFVWLTCLPLALFKAFVACFH